MTQRLPHVVIVGRPNVGKSTLFNRLAGKRRALTHELPGMTRDRLTLIVELDDGRRYRLTDTGGLEYGENPRSAFAREIREQADVAIRDADLILFVVDGVDGLTAEDRDIAQELRSKDVSRPVVVVNKIDTKKSAQNITDFHELGFDTLLTVSAEHAQNLDELFEMIDDIVPPETASEAGQDEAGPIRIAIIGRPNVGKSSLLNRLADEERSVVSEISGTTRDAIDTTIVRDGREYLLVDTAGIRRKGKTTDEAEKLSVISARKAIERCEIALAMIDGVEGVTGQDATVAGYAEEAGKAALILVNKWDVVEKTTTLTKEFEDQIRQKLKFLSYAPVEFISAKSGRRVEKLFPTIDKIVDGYRTRFRTVELNKILEQATRAHQPPSVRGKQRRFYYATQLRPEPTTIALFSNTDEELHFSYRRYLENQFREALGLVGAPVRLVLRARKGM